MSADHDVTGRQYRSIAAMISALREEQLLTQTQLAHRVGIDRTQLNRYEKGTVEPGLPTLRRLLAAMGWAPTFGLEPTTAALDVHFDAGGLLWHTVGIDTWASVSRVLWPALDRHVPLVVGGELAAALQGVPVREPELVIHLRHDHLEAFGRVVDEARATLGRPGRPGLYDDPQQTGAEDELVVIAGACTIRVRVSDTLAASTVVTVDRYLDPERGGIEVPVVDIAALADSGALGPLPAALVARRLEKGQGRRP
ncbi:MAG: helix-turn-helix domain-containing protein [Pseudonocardiaceae bacterium]